MIYVQSKVIRNNLGLVHILPHHGDAASAFYGAIDLGIDFNFKTYEDLFDSYGELKSPNNKNLLKQYCFVGSTEFMSAIFKSIGKNPKLPMNSDRKHYDKTLREVREDIDKNIIWFVKPYQLKLFSGLIVDKFSISSLKEFSDELHVMCYEPLPPILSEWRIYIHHNKIVDAKNYSGDFTISPNYSWIETEVKSKYKNFPCAYVMDVGILNERIGETVNKNVIIEFNDFWAIGNYGIPNDLYVRMLRDRYYEIIKN